MDAASADGLAQQLLGAASADEAQRGPSFAKLRRAENERPGELLVALFCLAYAGPEGVQAEARFLAAKLCQRVLERSGPALPEPQRRDFLRRLREAVQLQAREVRAQGGALRSQLPLLLRSALTLKTSKTDWGEHIPAMLTGLVDAVIAGSGEAGPLLHAALKALEKQREKSQRPMMAALLQKLGPCWAGEASSSHWKRLRYLDGSGLLLTALAPDVLDSPDTGAQISGLLRARATRLLEALAAGARQQPFFAKDLRAVWKWWSQILHARRTMFNVEIAQLAAKTLHGCWRHGELEAAARYCIRILQSSLQCAQDFFMQHGGDIMDLLCSCMRLDLDELEEEDVAGGGRDGGDAETLRSVAEQALKSLLTPKWPWAAALRKKLFGGGNDDAALVCVADFPELFPEFELAPLLGACRLTGSVDGLRLARLCTAVEAKVNQERAAAKLGPQGSFEIATSENWAQLLQTKLQAMGIVSEEHKKCVSVSDQAKMSFSIFAPGIAINEAGGQVSVTDQAGKTLLVKFPIKIQVLPSVAEPLEGLLTVVEAPATGLVPLPARLAALDACRAIVESKVKKAPVLERERIAAQRSRLLQAALALLPHLQSPEGQWRCLRVVQAEGNEQGGLATARGLLDVWRIATGEALLSRRLAVLEVLIALVKASELNSTPGGATARTPQQTSSGLSQALFDCCAQVVQESFGFRELQERGQKLLLGMMRTGEPSNLLALSRRVVALEESEAEATTVPRDLRWDLLVEAITLSRGCGDQELCALCVRAVFAIYKRTDLLATVGGWGSDEPLQQRLLRALHLLLLPPSPAEALQVLPALAQRCLEGRLVVTGFLPVACTWYLQHPQHFLEHAPPALAQGILEHVAAFKTVRVRAALLGTALALMQKAASDSTKLQALLTGLCTKCGDLLPQQEAKPKKGGAEVDGQFLLPGLPTSARQLPMPRRAVALLERALIPPTLHGDMGTWATQPKPGIAADRAVEDWLFKQLAAYLNSFGPRAQELARDFPVTVIRRLQTGSAAPNGR